MTNMPAYYNASTSYAEMLRKQDINVFNLYIDLFKKFVSPGSSVIDIGCGVGTSTLLLRQEGFDATGTDVSEKFLPNTTVNFAL